MKYKFECLNIITLFLLSFMMFVGCTRRPYSLPAITTVKKFSSITGPSTKNVNRLVDLKNVDSSKKDQEKAVVSGALPQGRSQQKRSEQGRLEDESVRLIEKARSNCVNCFYEINKNEDINIKNN